MLERSGSSKFAENAVRMAKERKIKIKHLENICGHHEGYLSKVKCERQYMVIDDAITISKILGVGIDDIMNYNSLN